MGAVGLALAIIAVAIGTVPIVGVMALIPASIGFVFSVVALVQARQTQHGKWLAIPGIVLSVAAACWIPIASTLIPMATAALTAVSLDSPTANIAPAGNAVGESPRPVQSILPPPPRNQYSPPAMRRQPLVSIGSGLAGMGDTLNLQQRRELEAQVAAVAKKAERGVTDQWPEEAIALRAQIDDFEDAVAKDQLNRALDDAVVAVVEADASAAIKAATAAQNAGATSEATRILNAFVERRRKAGDTVTYNTPLTQFGATATEFKHQLDLLQDPAQRYTPRGIVGGSHGVRVTLHDELTGETRVVEEGAVLEGGYTVVSIQDAAHEVHLTQAGKEYRLRW